MSIVEPTPREAQAQHQEAILRTLPRPTYKRIPVGKLKLHDELNPAEGANRARWEMYRDRWTPALAPSLIVAKDKGRDAFYVIDGRHRFLARKGILPAFIFDTFLFENLLDEQMSALFLYYNRERRNPSAMEKHLAASHAGDPVALAVDRVLKVRGAASHMRAIGACEHVFDTAATIDEGEQALNFTLRALASAWPGDPHRFDATLIRAVAKFWFVHGTNPKLRLDRLVKAMNSAGRVTPLQLKSVTETSRSSGAGAYTAIFRHIENRYADYNSGNRL